MEVWGGLAGGGLGCFNRLVPLVDKAPLPLRI